MDKRNCILLSAWDKGVGGSCLDSLLLRKRLRAASVTGQEALLGCLYTPGLAFFLFVFGSGDIRPRLLFRTGFTTTDGLERVFCNCNRYPTLQLF